MHLLLAALLAAPVDGGTPAPVPAPGFDRELVHQAVRAHLEEMRACYQPRLEAGKAPGRTVVAFVVSPRGAVSSAAVVEDTSGDEALKACLRALVLRLRFPARAGGPVTVRYPFHVDVSGQ